MNGAPAKSLSLEKQLFKKPIKVPFSSVVKSPERGFCSSVMNIFHSLQKKKLGDIKIFAFKLMRLERLEFLY